MWRSKKFIVTALLATVVLIGSIGGVVLANTGGEEESPLEVRCGAFLDKVCDNYEEITGVSINCTALKEAFAQAQSGMWAEHPKGGPPYGPMAQVFESLGYDQEAVQAAFELARGELEAGTLEGGRGAVMAKVLEILGIEEADWQAACQEMRGEKPEGWPLGPGFGFHGHGGFRGMGGMHGFGGPGGFEPPPPPE